jgi:hypothetical protein
LKKGKNKRKGLYHRKDKSDAQRKREARERKKREQEAITDGRQESETARTVTLETSGEKWTVTLEKGRLTGLKISQA